MEDLFSKELPVTVKYKNDREDRRANLHLSIYIDSASAPAARKDLVVRLTEERDLFFLYTLRLNEDEFQVLKVQQGLLVDFGSFPQKFIQLLELAISERSKAVPKFIIDLLCCGPDNPSACLNVIETNAFKHLTHLSLKLLPGCDRDIKDYLATCLKDFKIENEQLRLRLERSETELGGALTDARASLADKSRLLETAESDWSKRLSDASCEAANSANEERKRTLQDKSELIEKMDREKRISDEQMSKMIKELEEKLAKSDLSNKELTDTKYRNESSLREVALKLSTLDEEHRRCRGDVVTCRRELGRLEGVVAGLESTAAQSRTRIAVLDQELKDKDMLLTKTSELLELEQSHKTRGEEDIDRRRKQNHKLEGSVKKMSDELIKGNEIIKRLQNDIKGYHNKLKLRSQVIAEQEKLLTEKGKHIDEFKRSGEDSSRKISALKEQNKKLEDSLDSAQKQIEENKEVLKTNENVITWLNKQVTESQLASEPYSGSRSANPNSNLNPNHMQSHPRPPTQAGLITNALAGSLSQTSLSSYTSIPKPQVQFSIPRSGPPSQASLAPPTYNPASLGSGGVHAKPTLKTIVPLAKSSPIIAEEHSTAGAMRNHRPSSTIPLGTSPIIQQSAGLNLDSKYLQKSSGNSSNNNNCSPVGQSYPHQPIKVGKTQNGPPPNGQAPSSSTANRVTKESSSNVPPLMSSYFPR